MKLVSLHLLAMALLLPASARCGGGKYQNDATDRIKLYVLFEYHEGNVNTWEPLFKNASRLLFDATEKQTKISTVVFNNDRCNSARGRADVRIFDNNSRAFAVGLLDAIGYIGLSGIHKKNKPGISGHVGLAHEIGHYAFGLRDEYKDINGGTPAPGCLAKDAAGFDTASLMTAGTTELNGRTEFCFDGNHNTGKTQQDRKRRLYPKSNTFLVNSSSWKWIEGFARERYGAMLVLPNAPPTPGISGFGQEVQFSEEACTVRLSLGISSRNRPEAAVAALEKLVFLLDEDDAAGLLTAEQDIPVRQMATDNKFQSLTEIQKSDAPLPWLSLLQNSLRQLEDEDHAADSVTGSQNRVIVLISDGAEGNQGKLTDLLGPIDSRGVTVYSIGVHAPSQSGLAQVAQETGGTYLSADSTAAIDAAAMAVLANVKGRGIIEAREGRAGGRATLEPVEIPIDVTTTNGDVDFILAWSGPGDDLGMKLLAPDGTEVGATDPKAIFQNDRDRRVKRYRLLQPPTGQWRVVISNPSSAPRDYAFQVHSLAPNVMVTSSASEQTVELPEPILLSTLVAVDHPVIGAQVRARIERPDGSVVTINLFDNGDDNLRDAEADDGIYSGRFDDYKGSGTYDVEITVNSAGGSTTSPGEPGGTFTPEPVPTFVRKNRLSVVVTGAPN